MEPEDITAVVLAAGRSRRMGQPKLVLPWGNTTVIGKVVGVLSQAGLAQILVVTGDHHGLIEAALQGAPAILVHNKLFNEDNMASTLQAGLHLAPAASKAAMIVLGDQPQIETQVVSGVIASFCQQPGGLLIPSYQRRRGHPWIVGRGLWPALLSLSPPQTLRDFLNAHADQIRYWEIDRASILQDLDTPEDYQEHAPDDGGSI